MSTLIDIPLSEQLLRARRFATEEMPNSLLPYVDELIRRIAAHYEGANSPNGSGEIQALLWFDTQYVGWQQRQEHESAQELVDQSIQQLRMLGDVTATTTTLTTTVKGEARKIVFHLSKLVSVADKEKRDFVAEDVGEMDYFLSAGLVATRNYKGNAHE